MRRIRDKPGVTADRLTVASAVAATLAGGLFARRRWVAGGLVYQASFLLDCLDGKVASSQGKRHDWGGWFDQAGDGLRIAVCSLGMALGLSGSDDFGRRDLLLLVAYPNGRWAVNKLVGATPKPKREPVAAGAAAASGPRGKTEMTGSGLDVLRAAPRRAQRPGSTVDTEALAFTLGPVGRRPRIGLAAATAVDLVHVGHMLLGAVRAAHRGATI